MKTVESISRLLNSCSANIKRYQIPEPNSVEVESDEVDGIMTLRWDKKCHLDIFDKNILVWGKGDGSVEFTDLDTAFRKVVEYV